MPLISWQLKIDRYEAQIHKWGHSAKVILNKESGIRKIAENFISLLLQYSVRGKLKS